MGRAVVRPAARRDLVRHFAYIGENISLETARRFKQAAHFTFNDLARKPRMGAPHKVSNFPTCACGGFAALRNT